MKEVLITSLSLSPADVAQVETLLADESIEVHVLETKGLTDLVQLVFNDFDATAFVRDAVLSEVMQQVYGKIKPVLQHLQRLGSVKNVCIEKVLVTEDGRPIMLYLVTTADRFEQLLTELDYIPRERLISQSAQGFVQIRYDDEGRLEITDMGA